MEKWQEVLDLQSCTKYLEEQTCHWIITDASESQPCLTTGMTPSKATLT